MATHSIVTLSSSSAKRITPDGVHSGMDISIQNINNFIANNNPSKLPLIDLKARKTIKKTFC